MWGTAQNLGRSGSRSGRESYLLYDVSWKQLITVAADSQNLSFQAWNSMSSSDILAQLATARTAAATNSSFILAREEQTVTV